MPQNEQAKHIREGCLSKYIPKNKIKINKFEISKARGV